MINTKIACSMTSCKYCKGSTALGLYLCYRKTIVLNAYPKYIALAKKFPGTLRCMDYEEKK